jgi:hypothetical protein
LVSFFCWASGVTGHPRFPTLLQTPPVSRQATAARAVAPAALRARAQVPPERPVRWRAVALVALVAVALVAFPDLRV